METFLNEYNVISPIILASLFVPLLIGLFFRIKRTTIWFSLLSIFNLFEFALSAFLSFHLTRYLFITNKFPNLKDIKDLTNLLPDSFNPDIKIYVIFTPILFSLIIFFLKAIFYRFENKYLYNLSRILLEKTEQMWKPFNYTLRLLLNLPKSLLNVFMLCLFLNVASIYFPSPSLSDQLEQSKIYNMVNTQTIEPILNSRYIQKVPVLFNRTLAKTDISELSLPENENSLPGKTKQGIRIIWYFNGVTLEDAVKSNDEIDSLAQNLVKTLTSNRKKAKALYRWVGSNIKYDYEKAELISNKDTSASSGAIEAFTTRKGICFDMSALYAAMCRAVGLKVRLIAGTANSGVSWGEHSWNQVYIPEEGTWINVDTTFSIGGNYFDRRDFDLDHQAAKIAGEW
ncbi:MAG: transglutaminase-like domain-containing protein [Deltaproteobacteria bacterium]